MDMAPGLIHWDNLTLTSNLDMSPVQIGRVLLGTELSIQLALDFLMVIQEDQNAVVLMIQATFIVDLIQVLQDNQEL